MYKSSNINVYLSFVIIKTLSNDLIPKGTLDRLMFNKD